MTQEHTMRTGDWKQVFSGRVIYPLDPRKDEIFAEDIAHALGLICRFGGHCRILLGRWHSLRVAGVVAAAATQGSRTQPWLRRAAY
jgi:hypothetical protein